MENCLVPFNPFSIQGMLDLRPAMAPPRSPLESRGRQTPIETAVQIIFANMVTRRKKNGDRIETGVDRAYITGMLRDQGMRCALSGIPFDLTRQELGNRRPFVPSVDRIDNAKGYVPGNVRIVLSIVNYGLNVWGTDHYRAVCHAVARRDRNMTDEGIMSTGPWKYSTKPLVVFHAPDLTHTADDVLLPLDEAVWLPELNRHFDEKDLWRAANSKRLRTTRPTGKLHFTTRAWVRDWINSEWPDPHSPPASPFSKVSGASATGASKSALASARAKAQKLKIA